MGDDSPSSPPRGLTSSPSIFAYQTRLLDRGSGSSNSLANQSRPSPPSKSRGHSSSSSISHSPALASLAKMADSVPSTPIRRNVARMAAGFEGDAGKEGANGVQTPSRVSSVGGRGHAPSKSVNLVRGQWEAKIQSVDAVDTTPKASKRYTFTSPPSTSSASFKLPSEIPTNGVDGSNTKQDPPNTTFKPLRNMSIDSSASLPDTNDPPVPPSPALSTTSTSSRTRPASVASYTSVLSPESTGNSSVASNRSQAMEDTLAQARTNALKRREARLKALGKSVDSPTPPNDIPEAKPIATISTVVTPTPESATERTAGGTLKAAQSEDEEERIPTLKAAPASISKRDPSPSASPAPASTPAISHTPSTPVRQKTEPKQSSPFSHLFTPPSADGAADTESTPKSRPTRTTTDTPSSGSVASMASRYVASGLSLGPPPTRPTPTSGKDKYGSISMTDRRRLGRHLPRIASGGEGWDEDKEVERKNAKDGTARRVPSRSNLGAGAGVGASDVTATVPSAPASAAPPATPTSATRPTIEKKRSIDILAPSAAVNRPLAAVPPSPTVPSTPHKRRSAYLANIGKAGIDAAISSPRVEMQGADMKGLMHDVGGLAARGSGKDEGEGVTGMANRLRLSKATLPPSASSAQVAPAPLPSRRLMQTNWMDRQRHELHAYEYLCHVGEALQWIEGCLDEEVGFGVVEMEDALGDGVVLAKLARCFMGEGVVRSIWTESKHRYKQTDNINHFLKFARSVGMPETFIFELTDLYNKRNVPKVIFCIHVLSHLLARLGRAERIGNLVGQFDFTDEQLAATQKGLQGVAMPNFGDAKATLAKEASWEPEEPEETEDEMRDRLLLENEESIKSLQRHLRGCLARQHISRTQAKLDLAEPSIVQLQARARALLSRKSMRAQRDERTKAQGSITAFQATARARIAKQRYTAQVELVHRAEMHVAAIQAQARGMLVRARMAQRLNELDKARKSIVSLQALARGKIERQNRSSVRSALGKAEVISAVTSLQALLRGQLHRQAEAEQIDVLFAEEDTYLRLQAHLRGALARRIRRAEEKKLDDASDVVVAIQAVCRGVLARGKKQALVKAVSTAMPVKAVAGLQAFARAKLAQQNHQTMRKALAKVEVATSVGGLQAFLRSKLAKRQTTEQKKKLEFVSPDVIGFQAHARGYLARQEYNEWREYLHDPHTQGALVFLQSLIRGFNARRRLWIRTSDYHRNVDKIVKVQSLWRGRVQRRMYDKLMTGQDVDVLTVQNYMHLLNDTERDFADQIRTESLRKEVHDLVRSNQILETEVQELETKIALIVKNKMSFEELARAKRRLGQTGAVGGGGGGEAGGWSVSGQGDPFSGVHLDRASQRKLELFEHLFFVLQTKPDYLARLFRSLHARDEAAAARLVGAGGAMREGEEEEEVIDVVALEKDAKLTQGVTLALFGYGHERREEYLFHKLLQLSIHTDVLASRTVDSLAGGRFSMQTTTMAFIRDTLAPYLQATMTHVVADVVNAGVNLDLSTDPLDIYTRLINEEESITGLPSPRPRDRDADQVLQTDADARALYIRHLQELRHLTDALLRALYASVAAMPYSVRYLVREAFLSLRIKYDGALDEDLTPLVAKTFLLPFLLPGLIAPETWGIADPANPVGPNERRNLAAIANLIGIVAVPDHDVGVVNLGGSAAGMDRFVRVPLQEYIATASGHFRSWVVDLAAVEPLESFFEAHEMFDSTMEAKPIMITRKEIYGMLSVLMKNIPVITANKPKDPVALILQELEGPPVDFDKGKSTIALRLTNRLAELAPGDPEGLIREDYVQAKRHVLAVLRIQTGRTLYDVLVSRPEELHEQRWLEEVYRDMAVEQARAAKVGLPPTPVEAGYQIESIRSLPFHEVKSRAIEFCMKLERAGKITRTNQYQDLLISIAGDIRSKHHLRKMLRQGLSSMVKAQEDMSAKKRGLDESIASYHTFIDSSMANLQKGKKKPTFLSKQYRHQWMEEKHGRKAQFGSFKYTAHELYEKGILLGINQCSPRQFDKIHIVIASNEVGVFTIEMSSPASQMGSISTGSGASGMGALMGHEEVRMEDLLGAQFDNEVNLLLFDGMATFSINSLIHQINKILLDMIRQLDVTDMSEVKQVARSL